MNGKDTKHLKNANGNPKSVSRGLQSPQTSGTLQSTAPPFQFADDPWREMLPPRWIKSCARGVFATFNKYPPNSMMIWIDMVCLALALAPSCAALHFDASISCSQNPIFPEDVIERTGFSINPHIQGIAITTDIRSRPQQLQRSSGARHLQLSSPTTPRRRCCRPSG